MSWGVWVAWFTIVGLTGWACWRRGYVLGQRDEARRSALLAEAALEAHQERQGELRRALRLRYGFDYGGSKDELLLRRGEVIADEGEADAAGSSGGDAGRDPGPARSDGETRLGPS